MRSMENIVWGFCVWRQYETKWKKWWNETARLLSDNMVFGKEALKIFLFPKLITAMAIKMICGESNSTIRFDLSVFEMSKSRGHSDE